MCKPESWDYGLEFSDKLTSRKSIDSAEWVRATTAKDEIKRLQATGNACHRLVRYLHDRDLELYNHAGCDPAPVPAAVAEAGLEEVRRALRLIQKFSPLELEYLQEREAELYKEREAELCKEREAAEAEKEGTSDGD